MVERIRTPSGPMAGLLAVALMALTAGCTPDDVAAPTFDTAEDGRLVVPEGATAPVLLDGVFTPGEWADAVPVPTESGQTLRLKQVQDHVFIGVETTGMNLPIIDLFVQGSDGQVRQFHASAQLGERVLSGPGEDDPDFRWGMTSGWYANEVRSDARARDSLAQAGVEPPDLYLDTTLPYDGFEMQFRRSKIPGTEWRIRAEISAPPSPRIYPAGTERKNTDGWLVLELSPAPEGAGG